MYRFKRSLVALMGVLTLVVVVTVSMPHIGRGASGATNNAPTTQTQNVSVVNTPTVSAQQNGTWNVGINGTPTVNVASMPSVNVDVANTTNNPIPVVAPAPQTVLAFTATRNYRDQPLTFGPFDVSGFKDVRLTCLTNGISCQANYALLTSDERLAFSETFSDGFGGGSTVLNVPGQKISVFVICQAINQGAVTLEVYGRP